MKSYEKVIKFSNYANEKIIENIQKYPDSFEFCIIPSYEDKFPETHTECIQMGGVFANIIKNGDYYVLISIIFDEDWTVQEIVDWVKNYEITVHRPTSSLIKLQKVDSIIEAMKFKNHPIILCERGTESISLDPNELDEVTEQFETFKKITNTGMAESVEIEDDFLDKDDCLGRVYPGGSDINENKFEKFTKNIQYSESVRGLFICCQSCSFKGVIIHDRKFEIEEPYCPYCGSKINVHHCKWVNGPF